ELGPLVVAQSPDVAAALEVVVHRAEVRRRVAVRDQAAPRSDQDRQVLDPDRALVLARTAGRALPELFLGVNVAGLARRLASEERVLRAQDDRLRVELLAGAPRRTVHLAASALDAREGVEPHLGAEILHRLEPDLLFLEIEVRQVAQLRRLQEHSER